MENILYPLVFNPKIKNKIWGGEMWLLSGVEGDETAIANGNLAENDVNELLEIFMDDFIGENVFKPEMRHFPILVKIINSLEWLSVQVHPNDEMAAEMGYPNGKSEMWYIIHAEPDAHIIAGFNRKMTPDDFIQHVENNTLEPTLSLIPVKTGDAVFIPAGLVHALGPGILLAEIQQTSDVTYRIYDWNRTDEHGHARELHTELAAKAIDFDIHEINVLTVPPDKQLNAKMFYTKWFKTNFKRLDSPVICDYCQLKSFVILVFVEGKGKLSYTDGGELNFTAGSTILIPASFDEFTISPDENGTAFIEIFQ